MTLVINTPAAVPIQKAIALNAIIAKVFAFKNTSVLILEPTDKPKKEGHDINQSLKILETELSEVKIFSPR